MADTPITEDSLKSALTERLKATHVEVQDMSGGCGQAFTARIVSPQFASQTSLKRARLVNAALKDEIAQIHAWSAKCFTPEEWEREKAKEAANPTTTGDGGEKVEGVSG
ncbi:hypothetical protein VTJ04DRAFT_7139 [Mycothermus thermophilus]|uniref:uncharacterized protein n=1 Tax=Humicola insolens TaxID=85995 RepID=UPI003743E690